MKRLTLLLSLAVVACNKQESVEHDLEKMKPNTEMNLAFSPSLEDFIGKWTSDDQIAYSIDRTGDQLVIQEPENDTWRYEYSDISTSNGELIFTQKHYLKDGSSHPFNGVPCKCVLRISEGDSNMLELRMSSPHMPEGDPELFKKLN